MRIVVLIVTASFAGTVLPAQAQAVIDVGGQKATPQLQGQGQAQPPNQAPPETQESSQPLPSGRYSFNRVDDGFLRLDNASGEVAYCSARPAGWACEAVAIDRSALETETASVQRQVALLTKLDSEIARLHDEVASLKTEIAALKEPPPPRPPADLSAPLEKGSDSSANLPTQQDMARAREYLEETWRRLVEMIVTIQKDLMRKG
jgi:cell division protein FtsB